ncbi:MAG: hypothetical protein JWO86_1866 [Myxococcaceae bacterium]|nr:hypothetical protein [Myxococcaceae bacterium]
MKAPASLACAALICAACGAGGDGVRAPSARAAAADSHPSDAPALGAKTNGRTLVVQLTCAFVFETSGAALRRAAFLGGPGGRAEFDAVEGHDESAWLGYPAFDPRAVSAEVAG